jgi:hypothetical protein
MIACDVVGTEGVAASRPPLQHFSGHGTSPLNPLFVPGWSLCIYCRPMLPIGDRVIDVSGPGSGYVILVATTSKRTMLALSICSLIERRGHMRVGDAAAGQAGLRPKAWYLPPLAPAHYLPSF